MDTINLTKTATGGFLRTINGSSERNCSGIKYDTDTHGIKLFTDTNFLLTNDFLPPSNWTIEGVTGYLTIQEVCTALDLLIDNFNGVCNGTYDADALKSDTVDLPEYGYVEVLGAGGNIHFMDVRGNVITRAFDKDVCSKFRVKRIYSTGTTAAGLVIYTK